LIKKKNLKKLSMIFPEGIRIIREKSLISTNNYIRENLEELKTKTPVVVIAQEQSGGRGRESRIWFSPLNGGLYCSFLFEFNAENGIELLSAAAGIAAVKSIQQMTGIKCSLKWPNDIEFENKKTGGSLTENLISGKRVHSIIGIGINLNIKKEDFPEEIRDCSTSLEIIKNKSIDKEKIFKSLINNILLYTGILVKGQDEKLVEDFIKHLKHKEGEYIRFHSSGKTVKGKFRGINKKGGILVETEAGVVIDHYSGEIL